MSQIFLWCLGTGIAALAGIYLRDRLQTRHSVLRNYPLIGRFRYLGESAGEFLRQYLYLSDWEERPFNRLQRSWIYRSAKDVSNIVSFGSEQNPEFVFRNSAFPVLEEEKTPYPGKIIGLSSGLGACQEPFHVRWPFWISGMSRGALSAPAVSALSRGAATVGFLMTGHEGAPGILLATGEGGLAPEHLEGGADVIMQIGTAYYGVREADGSLSEGRLRELAGLRQVRMFEVKLSQGAKPGKGGILPAAKVTEEIARIRGIPPGQDSISPNRHRDIGDVQQLGDFVRRVRSLTGKPVGVKFVVGDESFLDDWFSDCAARPECTPDYIHVDGGEGGTGAAPAALAEYVGLPITQALPIVVEARMRHGLADRIRVVASGKLVTPDKIAWALCTGADFVASGRGFMFALGCIQALKCSSGKCPTGVTASDPRFVRGLDPTDKGVRVANYARRVLEEIEVIAHSCGLRSSADFSQRHVTHVERGVGGFRNKG